MTAIDRPDMREGEATPGPWRIEDDTQLIWGKCDPDNLTTFGMGYPVAECCSPRSWSKQHVPSFEERVANARLIAAAPDLLLAAKEAALIIADIVKAAHQKPTDSPMLMRLMDAVRKAEGRS